MSREATAWHEGGHLAAAAILGGRAGIASIKPGHWHEGQAEAHIEVDPEQIDAAWWAAVLGEPVDPQLRDRVERAAVVMLAGTVTEVRAAKHDLITMDPPPSPTAPAERTRLLAAINSGERRQPSDLESCDTLLRRITASEAEATAYREMLVERTYGFAANNPRFWPLAEAFARELLIRDELTAEEVAAVIAQANGEEPPDVTSAA